MPDGFEAHTRHKPLNALKASDYEVRNCPVAEGKAFIRDFHYSKGCSHTAVYMHGLYRKIDGALVGAAQWLPPTKPCAKTVHEDWRRVLSLSRLAVHPDVPTNGASFLIGRSVRLIKKDGRFVALVTFADEWQGHDGGIYRATNWTDLGWSKTASPKWVDPKTGRQVAVLSTKSRTKQQMIDLGYQQVGKYRKRKFVLIL